MTRIMARITIDKVNVPSITAALREAGYEVDVMPNELIEDPVDSEEFAFIEAWRDVAPQDAMDENVSSEMLTELGDIANRHGRGECWDCGPIPPDHVPHNYDSPWWRGRRH